MNRRFYNSFQEFADTKFPKGSIFRGHSNTNRFWSITSSYQRNFSNKPFSEWQPFGFEKILHASIISDYRNISYFDKLIDLNNLDLLIYLQHYGLPTPLIDFTKDHLTALYFAGSGLYYTNTRSTLEYGEKYDDLIIKVYNRKTLSSDEFDKVFELYPQFFISIIEFNLSQCPEIKDVEQSQDFNQRLAEECSFQNPTGPTVIFTVANPRNSEINFNLEKQNGSFVFFDSSMSLEEFIELEILANKTKPNPLTYHLIPKPCLNYPDASINGIETLYNYLRKREKTGVELFNDLQGMRYDINFRSGQ